MDLGTPTLPKTRNSQFPLRRLCKGGGGVERSGDPCGRPGEGLWPLHLTPIGPSTPPQGVGGVERSGDPCGRPGEGLCPLRLTPSGEVPWRPLRSPWGGVVSASLDANWAINTTSPTLPFFQQYAILNPYRIHSQSHEQQRRLIDASFIYPG